MQMVQQPKNPTLAAILSFVIPGLGQIYNGQVGKGILLIVVQIVNALLMAIVIGFFTGLAVLIYAIYDAYKTAETINQQYALQYGASSPAPTMVYPQLSAPAPTVQMSQPAAPTYAPAPAPAVAPAGMKKCPQCAEIIQGEAKVCRYCGYSFTASSLETD